MLQATQSISNKSFIPSKISFLKLKSHTESRSTVFYVTLVAFVFFHLVVSCYHIYCVCLNVTLVLCFGEIETACDLQCSESIIPTEYLLVPTGTYKCRVEPYQRGTVLGNNTDGVNYTDIVQNL